VIQKTENPYSMFFVVKYNDAIMNALAQCIRESSLVHTVNLIDWSTVAEESVPLVGFSQATFESLCDAIKESSSLSLVCMVGPLVADRVGATQTLAHAIAYASSLEKLRILADGDSNDFLMDQICCELTRTQCVRNFDVCFHNWHIHAGCQELTFTRTSPWKPLLSQDSISLALWPRMLAKGNAWNQQTWNQQTSHGSLDALFFLT